MHTLGPLHLQIPMQIENTVFNTQLFESGVKLGDMKGRFIFMENNPHINGFKFVLFKGQLYL